MPAPARRPIRSIRNCRSRRNPSSPIAMVAKTFGIVALRKDFPAKKLQEFIAYAKKNPGKINLGHAGVGSSNFLICKSFVQAAGIDVTLVGYRGAAPALTDAIGGQIDGVCDAAASVSQAIDDKLVKGIVVGSTVRLATLPELPTSAEAGLPEFEAQGWNGLFAPKGTPPAIIAKLNAAAQDRGGERCRQEALSRSLDGRARRQRAHAGSAAATGDARRREVPQAAGREEVESPATTRKKKPRNAGLLVTCQHILPARCRAGGCRRQRRTAGRGIEKRIPRRVRAAVPCRLRHCRRCWSRRCPRCHPSHCLMSFRSWKIRRRAAGCPPVLPPRNCPWSGLGSARRGNHYRFILPFTLNVDCSADDRGLYGCAHDVSEGQH